jgi:hypothetical protein
MCSLSAGHRVFVPRVVTMPSFDVVSELGVQLQFIDFRD